MMRREGGKKEGRKKVSEGERKRGRPASLCLSPSKAQVVGQGIDTLLSFRFHGACCLSLVCGSIAEEDGFAEK